MNVNDKYLHLVLPSLGDIETETNNGLTTYHFVCPWCYYFINSPKFRKRKCACLTPAEGSLGYNFICKRSITPECRRYKGGRSFHNFLAMYDTHLFTDYKKDLEELKTSQK